MPHISFALPRVTDHRLQVSNISSSRFLARHSKPPGSDASEGIRLTSAPRARAHRGGQLTAPLVRSSNILCVGFPAC